MDARLSGVRQAGTCRQRSPSGVVCGLVLRADVTRSADLTTQPIFQDERASACRDRTQSESKETAQRSACPKIDRLVYCVTGRHRKNDSDADAHLIAAGCRPKGQ